MQFPVVVQHRHVHLSARDVHALFGESGLTPLRPIGHHGQFLANQTVDVVGQDGVFEQVRVLGPAREHTQVELSASDAFAIGIQAPVRVSGDVQRSGSCTLRGTLGDMCVKSCAIIPARHLHCDDQTARTLGLTHHQTVSVALTEEDSDPIEHVVVRIHPTFANEFHISADEAALHWLQPHHRIRLC